MKPCTECAVERFMARRSSCRKVRIGLSRGPAAYCAIPQTRVSSKLMSITDLHELNSWVHTQGAYQKRNMRMKTTQIQTDRRNFLKTSILGGTAVFIAPWGIRRVLAAEMPPGTRPIRSQVALTAGK